MPSTSKPPSLYKCSCPDYTKSQSFLINTTAPSQTENRSWTSSKAGINKEKGEYCKHIWAAKIYRGDVKQSEIPNDVPVSPNEDLENDEFYPETYQQGYAGHDFTGNWGVTQF